MCYSTDFHPSEPDDCSQQPLTPCLILSHRVRRHLPGRGPDRRAEPGRVSGQTVRHGPRECPQPGQLPAHLRSRSPVYRQVVPELPLL